MGLFQKKPQVSNSAPLYTLGLHKTILVAGLGNIGKKYDKTRHNVGFSCVDEFVKLNDFGGWLEKKDLKCNLASGTIGSTRVIIIKPNTYMNNSGESVQLAAHFYKINPASILVLHDELAIDFGQIRTRQGGSDAGNNGVKSVIQHIGPDFPRIRIGIANEISEKADNADFVLGKFTQSEEAKIPDLTREVVSIMTEFIASGELPHDTRNVI